MNFFQTLVSFALLTLAVAAAQATEVTSPTTDRRFTPRPTTPTPTKRPTERNWSADSNHSEPPAAAPTLPDGDETSPAAAMRSAFAGFASSLVLGAAIAAYM